MATKNYIGKTITIPAGTLVTVSGSTRKRQSESIVTVRNQVVTRTGKTRVFWKSNGYKASAIV